MILRTIVVSVVGSGNVIQIRSVGVAGSIVVLRKMVASPDGLLRDIDVT